MYESARHDDKVLKRFNSWLKKVVSGSHTEVTCVAVVAVCIGKKHHKRTKTPSIAEKNMCEQQKKPIAICHLSIIYYLCNRKEEHDGIMTGSVLLLLQ